MMTLTGHCLSSLLRGCFALARILKDRLAFVVAFVRHCLICLMVVYTAHDIPTVTWNFVGYLASVTGETLRTGTDYRRIANVSKVNDN